MEQDSTKEQYVWFGAVPEFMQASYFALLTWSRMPWQWLHRAASHGQPSSRMAQMRPLFALKQGPKAVALMGLSCGLKKKPGSNGADPDGSTFETWVVT